MSGPASPSKQWNVYSSVSTFFRMQLESGIIPWQRSWHDAGIPRNAITGTPYRAVNLWILHSLGFKDNRFLTRRQIASIGGDVKRGALGYIAMKQPDRIDADVDDPCYDLFNIEQCNGLPTSLFVSKVEEPRHPHRICNDIILGMPKTQRDAARKRSAVLVDVTDCINFPSEESFNTADGMFASLFHFYLHGSGAPDRLNRTYEKDKLGADFPLCIIEELVADLGVGHLCSHAGIPIPSFPDPHEYAQSLSSVLEIQPQLIVLASAYAQEAVEHILNVTHPPDHVFQEEVDQTE